MLHMGEGGALASALNVYSLRTNARKRLREGWASRSDVWSRPFPLVANGAERMDALERPNRFRKPLAASRQNFHVSAALQRLPARS
jgi:hypothetical protein